MSPCDHAYAEIQRVCEDCGHREALGTSHELRYAEMEDGSRILDELVGRGHVHTEDLGGSIMLILTTDAGARVHLAIGLARLPRSEWWSAIVDALRERQWPCFWEPRQWLIEEV